MYTPDSTDNELLCHYQTSGDNRIIGLLFKRYATLVFGLCYKYLRRHEDAKDAVSEIFIIVLQRAGQQEIFSFKHWLYAVSKNYLYNHLHRDKQVPTEIIEKIPERFMENREDLSLYVREPEMIQLENGMSNLDQDQKICLELFYLQDKSYREVASETGFDLSKVKSCVQNGKRNLKIYLEEKKIRHEKRRT